MPSISKIGKLRNFIIDGLTAQWFVLVLCKNPIRNTKGNKVITIKYNNDKSRLYLLEI